MPTHPQDFVETVNPLQPRDVLAAPSEARFEDGLRREDPEWSVRDVEAYRSMLAEPSHHPRPAPAGSALRRGRRLHRRSDSPAGAGSIR